MIYILLMVAGLSLLLTGSRNTLRTLPIIIIISFVLFFLGSAFITLLPLIIVIIVIRAIFGKKQPRRTRTYYYSSTKRNAGNTDDFEEFFKQATGGSYEGYQRQTNNGNFGYMHNKDRYYKELGVAKTSTPDEIKKAYRTMAMKYHPDKTANLDDKTKVEYEAKFKRINEAYENLK